MVPRDPKDHRVTIFCHSGKAKVWPPYVAALPGDSIIFRTINTAAIITVPNHAAFDDPDGNMETGTGSAQGTIVLGEDKEVTLTAKSEPSEMTSLLDQYESLKTRMVFGKDTQMYSYSILCVAVNDYAEANSSPIIFIEPPQPAGG